MTEPATTSAPADHPIQDSLDDLPFDATERCVLDIARRLFMTFAMPATQSWIGALNAGTRHFGSDGLLVAQRAAQVLETLRTSRRDDFCFVNPDCPCCRNRITSEERYLLASLHAFRRGRRSEAVLNAMFVCGSEDHRALLDRIAVLALDLAQIAEMQRRHQAADEVT